MEFDYEHELAYLSIPEQLASNFSSPRPIGETSVRAIIDAKKAEYAELLATLALDDDEVGPIERHAAQHTVGKLLPQLNLLKEMDIQLNPDDGSFDALLRREI